MYGERRELIGQSSFSKALLKEKAADASGRSGGHGFRPLRRQLAHAELSRLDIKRRKEEKKRERKEKEKLLSKALQSHLETKAFRGCLAGTRSPSQAPSSPPWS